ncbi:MAG: hypothetical protein ACOVQ0_04290, partial [Novosphingobium sp.]|uniref:hypothetical protein n=1 Tax=Novosphingobium sp. TaxID=1874826 RepID=UPI003B98F360
SGPLPDIPNEPLHDLVCFSAGLDLKFRRVVGSNLFKAETALASASEDFSPLRILSVCGLIALRGYPNPAGWSIIPAVALGMFKAWANENCLIPAIAVRHQRP